MTVITDDRRSVADYLISEAANIYFSREQITLTGAAALKAGTVLGTIMDGARTAVGEAGTPAPAGATISAEPVATTAAQLGVHRFVCVTAGVTGKWDHIAPGGEKLGQATTGTEYVGAGLTLTITDAGTDPAKGEELIVTVTEVAGNRKRGALDLAATNGLEIATGILFEARDPSAGDVQAVETARMSEVKLDMLFWPEGISAGQKQTALDQLAGRGIIARQ